MLEPYTLCAILLWLRVLLLFAKVLISFIPLWSLATHFLVCHPTPTPPQMSAYVHFGLPRSSGAAAIVVSLLRMQAPAQAGVPGLCTLRELSALTKPVLEAGFQLLVVLSMIGLWLLVGISQRLSLLCRDRRCCGHRERAPSESSSLELYHGRGYASFEHGDVSRSEGTSALSVVVVDSDAPDGTLLSSRARCVTAAVNFALTAYAALTVTSIKLLHCVWIPGTPESERRLFVSGSTVCNLRGWQLPLLFVLAALVAMPIVLAVWTTRALRRVPHTVAAVVVSTSTDVKAGLRRAVVETYNGPFFWWESVLMAQRLVRFCWYKQVLRME